MKEVHRYDGLAYLSSMVYTSSNRVLIASWLLVLTYAIGVAGSFNELTYVTSYPMATPFPSVSASNVRGSVIGVRLAQLTNWH